MADATQSIFYVSWSYKKQSLTYSDVNISLDEALLTNFRVGIPLLDKTRLLQGGIGKRPKDYTGTLSVKRALLIAWEMQFLASASSHSLVHM